MNVNVHVKKIDLSEIKLLQLFVSPLSHLQNGAHHFYPMDSITKTKRRAQCRAYSKISGAGNYFFSLLTPAWVQNRYVVRDSSLKAKRTGIGLPMKHWLVSQHLARNTETAASIYHRGNWVQEIGCTSNEGADSPKRDQKGSYSQP